MTKANCPFDAVLDRAGKVSRRPFLRSSVWIWVLVSVGSWACARDVVIEVAEHAGVARESWPVTGGVPLARGAVTDPAHVQLAGPSGQPQHLQCRPLARWEDGSIKWLLVDFLATVGANETQRFRLRIGPKDPAQASVADSPLSWRKTQDGVQVDTGQLRAVISRRLLESVSIKDASGNWLQVVEQPGEMWMSVNGDNKGRYLASRDPKSDVAIEESGPNHVCVRVSGWHHDSNGARFGAYTLRVHAYAGKPYLRVFHTFVNSDLPERGLITGIGLRMPLALEGRRVLSYGGKTQPQSGTAPCWLTQNDWNQQEVQHDGKALALQKPLAGFLGVLTPQATAACIVRDWTQLYPKKLELNEQGLAVWFWPESCGPFDLRREEQKQSPEWLWFKENCPDLYKEWHDPGTAKSAGISPRRYRIALRKKQMSILASSSALGLARTHEMLWVFLPGSVPTGKLEDLSACLHEPLLPVVNPRYLDETEALGRLGWQDRKRFPLVENYILRKLDWICRHQNEWARWWGILDWGGMQTIYERLRSTTIPGQWLKMAGRHGWHNSEVDIPNHVMYHYLRSGNRGIFHFYDSILRHQMDVDTIHLNLPDFEAPGHEWQDREWTRGGMHRHSYNHYSGGDNIGHTWNEGLVNYYFLTGDRRAYDVALEVGEYSLGAPVGKVISTFDRVTKHPRETAHFARDASNAYRNTLKCYEMTGDEKWKQAALRWRQHFLDHSPQYMDKQPATFHVTTYLVRTMALDYHIFGEQCIAEELARIARWHCQFMKRGFDQRGLHYPYLACGLAWWATRDNELLQWPWYTYLSECQSKTPKAQGPRDFTQAHFYELGQLPFFLRACQEAGFSEAQPPPPVPKPSKD